MTQSYKHQTEGDIGKQRAVVCSATCKPNAIDAMLVCAYTIFMLYTGIYFQVNA